MNQEILMSIRPQHLVNILNGKKTIELRKRFPKDYRGWVYLYCTKDKKQPLASFRFIEGWRYRIYGDNTYYSAGCTSNIGNDVNGKVVCRFWVDKVEEIYKSGDTCHFTNKLSGQSLTQFSKLSDEELENYLGYGGNKIEVCGYAIHISKLEIFDKPKELGEFKTAVHYPKNIIQIYLDYKPLTKAPQSWQYIYIEEEK